MDVIVKVKIGEKKIESMGFNIKWKVKVLMGRGRIGRDRVVGNVSWVEVLKQ